MKAIVLTLCVMTVAVTCSPRPGGHGRGLRLFHRDSFKKCMEEMDIKKEDFKTLKENNDPKLDCLKSCAMTKEEIMDEAGNIDSDKLVKVGVEIAQKMKPDLNVEELDAALRACAEKAKEIEDKCQKAKSVNMCTFEYWKTNVKGGTNPGGPSSSSGDEE